MQDLGTCIVIWCQQEVLRFSSVLRQVRHWLLWTHNTEYSLIQGMNSSTLVDKGCRGSEIFKVINRVTPLIGLHSISFI